MTYIRSRVFDPFFLSFFLAINEGKNYFIAIFFRSSCERFQLIVPFGPGGPRFPGGPAGPARSFPVLCLCCPEISTRLYHQQMEPMYPLVLCRVDGNFLLIGSNSSSVFRLQQSL